jgi:hypothetical protein
MQLADEAPTPALQVQARRLAADALLALGQHELAREQYDAARALAPGASEVEPRGADDPARCSAPSEAGGATGPRQVLLFSGHMVDTAGRERPRLPASKLPAVEQALRQVLDDLAVGPGDLLLTQGAAGGDLMFAEACAARGVCVELLLPLAEPQFIERSVLPSADGERWRARYFALRPRLAMAPRVMADELGPGPPGMNAFERCNRWLLYSALARALQPLHFVCLWDGAGGQPGGTADMYDEVVRRAGRVHWIDTRKL